MQPQCPWCQHVLMIESCDALIGTFQVRCPDTGCDWTSPELVSYDAAVAWANRRPTLDVQHDDCATMDDVVREVLCRVFEPEVIPDFHAWYQPQQWFWWGRALGAFIRARLDNQKGMLSDEAVIRAAAVYQELTGDVWYVQLAAKGHQPTDVLRAIGEAILQKPPFNKIME